MRVLVALVLLAAVGLAVGLAWWRVRRPVRAVTRAPAEAIALGNRMARLLERQLAHDEMVPSLPASMRDEARDLVNEWFGSDRRELR